MNTLDIVLHFVWNVARKATGAGILATVTGIGVACQDGQLTSGEVVTSIGAGLLAAVSVYRLENKG